MNDADIKRLPNHLLGLECPILQAPLAGGGDTPALVAAVCNAGALGFVGAAYRTPQQIADTCAEIRCRTARPFGINLFAPQKAERPGEAAFAAALRRIAPWYQELGIAPPSAPALPDYSFEQQFAATMDSGAHVFSFTLGVVPDAAIHEAHLRGMLVFGTATTLPEAQRLEAAGVDAIVAQGSEAGGHRATFAGDWQQGMIGTMALVPQIADEVGVPVIASGGIMDGRGICAALALGAVAVQMGTAFLTCSEAGIPETYKQSILEAGSSETGITTAFSGRAARGIVNRFMRDIDACATAGDENGNAADGNDVKAHSAVLPFPWQNELTRPLRLAAARQGRPELLSLWAGQGLGLARRCDAATLIARLRRELDTARRGVAAGGRAEATSARAGSEQSR